MHVFFSADIDFASDLCFCISTLGVNIYVSGLFDISGTGPYCNRYRCEPRIH